MKIIIDTNFFVSSAKFKVDIYEELKGNELYITESVERELNELAKKDKNAKLARAILKTKALTMLKSKYKSADRDLIEFGKEGYTIATQDKELKTKLKSLKVKVLNIRQKKYVCD